MLAFNAVCSPSHHFIMLQWISPRKIITQSGNTPTSGLAFFVAMGVEKALSPKNPSNTALRLYKVC